MDALMESIRYYVPMENPKVVAKAQAVYPGCIRTGDLAAKIHAALVRQGFDKDSTQLATSLSCDEVTRELERQLGGYYGDHFSMGGLAGFPFGGVSSFKAMARHIPVGGNCLIVYAPQVGIDSKGEVGKIERVGKTESSPCCECSIAAHEFVKKVMANEVETPGPVTSPLDAQQTWVGSMLLRHGIRLQQAADPSAELPLALFDCMDEFMKKIVKAGCNEVPSPGRIALVGGIQIITPPGTADFFLPMTFELRNNNAELQENLMDFLLDPPAMS
mmetsp:Transcript_13095/g.17107  ORF Transcript_13095/g.17107 Transcript_13095/m.17107 type:complete len:274 (+) Transcript_13095:232-1053(+)